VTPLLLPLDNPIKDYRWGSRSALASIRGEAPTDGPEAELWMGAHPAGPSRVTTSAGTRSLGDLIAEQPAAVLGERVARDFEGRLPFLLKLLAAAEPLSLQAHPSLAQAKLGFEREEIFGIPLDAPHRSYKDPSHKPELICALTRFHALVGFRPIERTRELLSGFGASALAPLLAALALTPESRALRTFLNLAITAPGSVRQSIADATLEGCRAGAKHSGMYGRELAWGERIGELYPGDPGIVVALALNLVVLSPGQAVYLPAGNLHAYLEGTGVEIMASSDNVLRGGLTNKHIDVPELLDVLDFKAAPVSLVRPTTDGKERFYPTPAREFALSSLVLAGETARVGPVIGPEILVVTAGAVSARRGAETVEVGAGHAVFVPAAGGDVELSGSGTVFRARVNDAAG
jgi:mannose-6-phosphate isomerase